MTTLNTDPELNPPVVENNPGQEKIVEQTTQVLTTNYGQNIKIVRPFARMPNPTPISWTALANVSRMFSSKDWSTSQSGLFAEFELTVANIINWTVPLIPPTSYFDFDSITFSISKNTNAMYQGKMLIVFDPAAKSSYYEMFGLDLRTLQHLTQMNYVEFDPRDSKSVEMTIDNLLPFDCLRMQSKTRSGSHAMFEHATLQKKYVENYSLGRLIFFQLNSLTTTSSVLNVPIQISVKLNGYRYSGRSP